MIKYTSIFLLLFTFLFQSVQAQTSPDSSIMKKEFDNLDDALKNPQNVLRLNLSNQKFQIPDSIWLKFVNLQYLSLKNDHLKKLPEGIGNLKNLKVLDLSGNDLSMLPTTFTQLSNLEELYLNDDKKFRFDKNIPILSKLPKLKSLHIENDGLQKLPKNIFQLDNIESLYLNKNRLKKIPLEIKELKNLKYLDLQDNKFKIPSQNIQDIDYGLKIIF